ncbi:hypothetical protein KAFR_0A07790 [Kazachstania africana CBS 2517]|uniref:K Homology domain-containing protein n=1 Tax=Kazachstania africana (strain ATCC 22294 / BCRC 22015 / CBS 2517 / CECT 1963 / NBRC 1671 / NRRL Y-8276) TaxID=1071382 RepID=H2APB3_KAZAF|nr:hypothetical protein KAFR_0A07790 [Kazachstania africana CBS 2517]CCF56213.1 hypothetical protein KAFR_0A07790 [Kazachstania africana CBS 2517]
MRLLRTIDFNSLVDNCVQNGARLKDAKSGHVPIESVNDILNKLKVGDSYQLKRFSHDKTYLCFLLNFWSFKSVISNNKLLQSYVYAVSRFQYTELEVMCSSDDTIIESLIKRQRIKLKASNRVCIEELLLTSEIDISDDSYTVTLHGATIPAILCDIKKNILKFRSDIPEPVTQFYLNSDQGFFLNYLENLYEVTPHPKTSLNCIETHDIDLTKQKISFLIGKNGTRIEQIRDSSGAIIKIIPLPRKLKLKEQNCPDSVLQTISLTGEPCNIAMALSLIASQLQSLYYIEKP